MQTPPIDRVLGALRTAGCTPKPSGNGWECRCPAHDDKSPSLSISTGDKGKVLLKCFAECETEAVVKAIGLKMADLMPPRPSNGAGRNGRASSAEPKPATKAMKLSTSEPKGRTFSAPEAAVAAYGLGEPSSAWTHENADDEPVGAVARWDRPDGEKQVRPVSRVDGGSWTLGAMPEPRPLLYSRAIDKAGKGSMLLVAEGEPATDALRSCGLTATTSAGGWGAASKTDWSMTRDQHVVILPDHDDAGEKYASDVATLCADAGAASVKIVRLAEHWPDLPEGGDAADVLEIEGGDLNAVRVAIEKLTDAAEPIGVDDDGDALEPAKFEKFPVEMLPTAVRRYVVETAGSIGCDASFVALPMLAALAGAIGNTRRLFLKKGWAEKAIIWAVIVGESGTIKTPSMKAALAPVKKRQHHAMKEHAEEMKAWKAAHLRWSVEVDRWKKSAAKGDESDPPEEPEMPVCPRTWIDDITTEALVKRLQENPRGLLVARNELSGWLDLDRYSAGKGGGDAAKWLEVFDGESLIVDRKGSGTEYVPRAAVSVTGSIQPKTLRRALGEENVDNGLAARMLFAWPPRTPKGWIDGEASDRAEADLAGVFERLYALEMGIDSEGDAEPQLVRLNPEAKRAFAEFVDVHGKEQMALVGDKAAAWAKLEGYAARFALIFHLVRVASGDSSIADPLVADAARVEAGIRLSRWFEGEVERIYALLAGDAGAHEREHLVELIEGKGGDVSARDLARTPYCKTTAEAEAALESLVAAGRGRWDHPAPEAKGGRPAKRFILRVGGDDRTPAPRGHDNTDTDKTPAHGGDSGGIGTVSSVSGPESGSSVSGDPAPELAPRGRRASSTDGERAPVVRWWWAWKPGRVGSAADTERGGHEGIQRARGSVRL